MLTVCMSGIIVVTSHVFVCLCVDMGSGLYGASKGIAVSDLITTITPERRTEEKREEPGKRLPISCGGFFSKVCNKAAFDW